METITYTATCCIYKHTNQLLVTQCHSLYCLSTYYLGMPNKYSINSVIFKWHWPVTEVQWVNKKLSSSQCIFSHIQNNSFLILSRYPLFFPLFNEVGDKWYEAFGKTNLIQLIPLPQGKIKVKVSGYCYLTENPLQTTCWTQGSI